MTDISIYIHDRMTRDLVQQQDRIRRQQRALLLLRTQREAAPPPSSSSEENTFFSEDGPRQDKETESERDQTNVG